MERITREHLEVQLKATAHEMGRPIARWSTGDSIMRVEPGALALDHYSPHGWDVVEMVNDAGGERSLIGNRRLDARSMLACLRGMEEAARIVSKVMAHAG